MTRPQSVRRSVPSAVQPAGGAFESHVPEGASVLDAWTQGRPFAAFADAPSAFWALARTFPDAAVWLPAPLDADFIDAAARSRVRAYPVLKDGEPDFEQTADEARFGDLVLVAADFGLPPGPAVEILARFRPDLRIVEDCTRALVPAARPVGGWRLFSAREFGLPDGAVLVNADDEIAPPEPAGPEAMRPESLALLRNTALAPLAARRLNGFMLDMDSRPDSRQPRRG